MTRSEVQFTKDIKLHTPFNFEVWVYHPDQATYPGVKFCYHKESYKNIWDFISTGNLGQGSIPAVDTMENDTVVFPFDYTALKRLQSSIGAELRLTMDDDIPAEGERATATFYLLIVEE